jgi:hypothetical protein
MHTPLPSHSEAGTALLPLHTAGEHTVPATCSWQPPLPSQAPLRPHVAAACATQAPRGSGAPAATGWQVPALPVTLQARQDVQAPLSQQTPSVQWPLAQSPSPPQAAPSGFGPQLPPMHWVGGAQSALVAHIVRQLEAPQA